MHTPKSYHVWIISEKNLIWYRCDIIDVAYILGSTLDTLMPAHSWYMCRAITALYHAWNPAQNVWYTHEIGMLTMNDSGPNSWVCRCQMKVKTWPTQFWQRTALAYIVMILLGVEMGDAIQIRGILMHVLPQHYQLVSILVSYHVAHWVKYS